MQEQQIMLMETMLTLLEVVVGTITVELEEEGPGQPEAPVQLPQLNVLDPGATAFNARWMALQIAR